MEIAAQILNFAFYHPSQSVYCTAEVLEINIFDNENKYIHHFRTVEKGQKISFKYTKDNHRELLKSLQDRILKIRCIEVEIPKDCKHGTKFIIERVQSCDILQVIKKLLNRFYFFNFRRISKKPQISSSCQYYCQRKFWRGQNQFCIRTRQKPTFF